MSERVGNVSFETPQPGEMVFDKPYSEQTAQMIDEEVRKIIETSFNKTFKLLTDKKSDIEKVSLQNKIYDPKDIKLELVNFLGSTSTT